MRKISWILWLGLFASLSCTGQPALRADGERTAFATFRALKDSLETVAASGAEAALDTFWQALQDARRVPFAVGDSVAFLYRGAAERVAWHGDFDGWGSDASVASEGARVAGADLWILASTFPADARIDYKIVLDGNRWMLDPANPLQQWSGFGPNSELRMPAYVPPPETVPRPGLPRGLLSDDLRIESKRLGYEVLYRVYTPAGYDTLAGLPTLYVTDGPEYADDRMGGMTIVLDNVIADGLVEPVLVVFVDPREPGNPGNNRRQHEYADAYEDFAAFLADELVPAVDRAYKTEPSAERRGILGTSLGGIFSAYLGAARPDVFHCIALHSPAFWYDTRNREDRVYRLYTEATRLPLKIFMSTGTIHDTEAGARRMRAVFEAKAYPLRYVEVHEGHSWGNWRALLDEPLRFCWGTHGP